MQLVIQAHVTLTELDAGFHNYAAYTGDMAVDGMDGNMMYDDYPGSMAYERHPYPEH